MTTETTKNPKFTGSGDLEHIEQWISRALTMIRLVRDREDDGMIDGDDTAVVCLTYAEKELDEAWGVAVATREAIEAATVPQ